MRHIAPLLVLALTGCASLGRDTPPLERYVLGGALEERAAPAPPAPGSLRLGVRRLTLAPYLAVPAIVVRQGDHQIVLSEFHRWGEDLAAGISRAVAGHLAAGPSDAAVDVAPLPVGASYDYLIQLDVTRFEGAVSDAAAAVGEARMTVSWEIVRQGDGTVAARGATDHREPGWQRQDYAGLVALLDQGLQALAGDLESCLGSMASTPTGSGTLTWRGPALRCAP